MDLHGSASAGTAPTATAVKKLILQMARDKFGLGASEDPGSDLDLVARTVRVREQLVELDGGEMVLCPPKSRAGNRIVGIRAVIVPELTDHLETFVEDRPDAFVFPGSGGGFLRGDTSDVR